MTVTKNEGLDPLPIAANEWEATGNYTLYTDANRRLAEDWRASMATDPRYEKIWQQALGAANVEITVVS